MDIIIPPINIRINSSGFLNIAIAAVAKPKTGENFNAVFIFLALNILLLTSFIFDDILSLILLIWTTIPFFILDIAARGLIAAGIIVS